eukprot:14905437-Alexandrium_andersonii.AAC.1
MAASGCSVLDPRVADGLELIEALQHRLHARLLLERQGRQGGSGLRRAEHMAWPERGWGRGLVDRRE